MDDIYTICRESLNSLKGDDIKTCVLCLHLLMGGTILKLSAIKKGSEKKKKKEEKSVATIFKNITLRI